MYVYMCMYVYMYICMYICVCMYICICIYIYVVSTQEEPADQVSVSISEWNVEGSGQRYDPSEGEHPSTGQTVDQHNGQPKCK